MNDAISLSIFIITTTIHWFSNASTTQRVEFIKALLGRLSLEELAIIEDHVAETKSHSQRSSGSVQLAKKDATHASVEESGVKSSLRPPLSWPGPLARGWWRKWRLSNVLALDCEHVHLKDAVGRERVRAGIVSIVTYNRHSGEYEELYGAQVHWPAGSFVVNCHTLSVNGIHASALACGKPPSKVTEEVRRILKNKLVITCGGTMDFVSLGLSPQETQEFTNFDLQRHFRRPIMARSVKKWLGARTEPIALRSLHLNFFGEDIQASAHSAFEDAKATLRIFLEKYIVTEKILEPDSMDNRDYVRYSEL